MTVVDKMESMLRSVRVKNPTKIELLKSSFSEHVDYESIQKAIE